MTLSMVGLSMAVIYYYYLGPICGLKYNKLYYLHRIKNLHRRTSSLLLSRSQIGRQISLSVFYALYNGNSHHRNRHNLCLCGNGGNVLHQFCFEPLLSYLFPLYQAKFRYKKDSSRYQLDIV